MSNVCQMVKIDKITPPWNMLKSLHEDSVEWLELVDSIQEHGLLNSILVRPHPTREGYYQIIDGYSRFSACKSLDFSEIQCIIKNNVNDEEYLALQIQANAIVFETRPVEFAEQMQRIIVRYEDIGVKLTLSKLGVMVNKSPSWVSDRLRLLKLSPACKKLVRDEKISLGKALALTRIPRWHEQDEFVGRWEVRKRNKLTNREFELEVGKYLNERFNDPRKQRTEYIESPMRPRLQSMDTLLMELDRMSNISQIIVQENAQTALEGAKLMLEWVLNLHPDGRSDRVREARKQMRLKDRLEIIGRQRYEELEELRKLREERAKVK